MNVGKRDAIDLYFHIMQNVDFRDEIIKNEHDYTVYVKIPFNMIFEYQSYYYLIIKNVTKPRTYTHRSIEENCDAITNL